MSHSSCVSVSLFKTSTHTSVVFHPYTHKPSVRSCPVHAGSVWDVGFLMLRGQCWGLDLPEEKRLVNRLLPPNQTLLIRFAFPV